MQSAVRPSTIRALFDLEQEMVTAQRTNEAQAIREALAALARSSRGWLSTGDAAERLQMSIPTVKDWIRRGTLEGQRVGSRWRVSEASVDKVLQVRETLAESDEAGYPTEEEIQELTKKVRRQMATERDRQVG